MEAFSLKDKNILITGATGGIGKHFLKAISKRSPKKVFTCSSHPEHVEGLKNEFPSLIEGLVCDLSTEQGNEQWMQFVQHQLKEGEKIDLVLFLAGHLGIKEGQDFPTWDQAQFCWGLNVLSPVFCFKKMVEKGLLKKGSCVLSAGSIAGHISYPEAQNIAIYSMTKSALHRAVMNWATDHPEMTIFELAFGAVQTKMLDQCRPSGMSKKDWDEGLLKDIPIGEVADPEVLAETVIRILETPGYRLFHGDVLHLSGGEHIT